MRRFNFDKERQLSDKEEMEALALRNSPITDYDHYVDGVKQEVTQDFEQYAKELRKEIANLIEGDK